MMFHIYQKKYLDIKKIYILFKKNNMDNENKDLEIDNLIRKSAHISFIIHIHNGEIDVQTSGPSIDYMIVNENAQSIIIKKVKDPFMIIPSVVKSYFEKWKTLQKKKT